MSSNTNQPKPKKKEKIRDQCEQTYAWNPEKMLTALLSGQEKLENNWVEKGLPTLVDDIITNYETFGGMDHLEGKDLPSKKVVIEVLEDFLTVVFPGYLGRTEITKSNVKYVLGNTLNSIYTRLTAEGEKSLKHICRKIKECPQDVCHRE